MEEPSVLQGILRRYRAEINAELRAAIGESQLPLYQMLRYHLGWVDQLGRPRQAEAGKLLRPTLCLMACEAVGGDFHRALPVAAALELVHNFSLIHDDIEDRGMERHHRPTLWTIWGEPQAINAGDAMHALAHSVVCRLEALEVPADKITKASHLLDRACLLLCEGQYLDLSYESRLDIGVEAYLEMIERKTATLIECSLHEGALLGSDDEWLIQRFRTGGRKLGLAFQIRDDILGIWGRAEVTGKSSTTDIQTKKKSLPVVYALERAPGKQRDRLRELYLKPVIEESEAVEVLEILNATGTAAQAQSLATQFHREALAELEATGIPAKALAELKSVAAFLVQRHY
ncbi:MAG: polyprenyl synthetase family protein [Chloroflexota bacterium]